MTKGDNTGSRQVVWLDRIEILKVTVPVYFRFKFGKPDIMVAGSIAAE
jgi:hypothetical protein